MHEGHRERLRQSYLYGGADAMHEHQLLELLLTYAIPRRDVNPLAHELISTFGSLSKVLAADPHELMQVPGVGPNAAILLTLAGRLERESSKRKLERTHIMTPRNAEKYCCDLLANEKYERFWLICLDLNKRVIHTEMLAKGSLTEARIYPRVVAEVALRHGAHSVILCHNHPSGSASPSVSDVDATRAVRAALTPLGIALHDHIIVGDGAAYSMLSRGSIDGDSDAQAFLAAAEPFGRLEDN